MLITLTVRLQGGDDSANLAKSWHGGSAVCQVLPSTLQNGQSANLANLPFCQELRRMRTLKLDLSGSKYAY
eukprot:6204218-Pleurochrysis_carterae.AAC.2